MRNIVALDGLRAFAALIVVVSHLSNSVQFKYLGAGAGQIGVMIFFALSGFLMLHVTDEKKFNLEEIRIFYIRRLGRVMPLYVFIVIFSYLTFNETIFGIKLRLFGMNSEEALLYHLTFQLGNGVLWTIGVEILFYLIFPIFWYLKNRFNLVLFLIILLILDMHFFGRYYEQFYIQHKSVLPSFLKLFTVIHYFLAGMLCYELNKFVTTKGRSYDFYFLLCVALVVVSYPQIHATLFGRTGAIWGNTNVLVLIGMLLILTTRSKLAEITFGSSVMRYLGNISYSIYLVHVIAIMVSSQLFDRQDNTIAYVISVGLLTLFMSSLTYYVIECPTRRFFNNLTLTK